MPHIDELKIKELLTRGVEEVIDRAHLEEKLKLGKTLRIKLGIDPTSPNIHVGRAVGLWKLRAFQELGHKAIFIVGDATGVIGDSSDKDSERPMLTKEQVKKNGATYFQQAFKILDKKKTEIHCNSEWLKKLGYLELGKMANLFGLHEFAAREVIAKRMDAGKRVSYLELMYPLFQGYDSVAVKADVELGGTDQRFNLLTGRKIQQFYGQEPQDIVMTTLLEGTDGRKMSSSWGNTINLFDSPEEMFGKTMSIPDELIVKYFTLTTRVSLAEIEEIKKLPNPRDQKAKLAFEIVKLYHGEEAAQEAEEEFNKTFRDKKPTFIDYSIDEIQISYPELISRIAGVSTSEAKRLILAGAVEVNGIIDKEWKKMIDIDEKGIEIRVGKRIFFKVRLN